MMVNNHVDGALECVLYPTEIEALVKALNAYEELSYAEFRGTPTEHAVDSLRTALELAAHAVALAQVADLHEVLKTSNNVRRRLGYSTNEKEVAA
ncbi:MAG: hypothetical protein JXR40_06890 [Pontiellaceae bacterium]|nr:hypothetical protein [Pontiellaceae bacterium]